MTSPPCFQSHKNPILQRRYVRSLESDIVNLELASPIAPSNPTIWVAELSFATRNAPSPVPKPIPCRLKLGTGRSTILLRFRAKIERRIQFASAVRSGDTGSAASKPRLRISPPLNTRGGDPA